MNGKRHLAECSVGLKLRLAVARRAKKVAVELARAKPDLPEWTPPTSSGSSSEDDADDNVDSGEDDADENAAASGYGEHEEFEEFEE